METVPLEVKSLPELEPSWRTAIKKKCMQQKNNNKKTEVRPQITKINCLLINFDCTNGFRRPMYIA